MITLARNTAKNVLDKIGITATSLCAIHCLLLPFLLPVLPLIGAGFLAQERFERSVLMFTMGLGFIALCSGYRRHHRRLFPFFLLFSGGFIYWNKSSLGIELEAYIVLCGATLVVLAHLINMKLCRRCTNC